MQWSPFPAPDTLSYDRASLRRHWPQLHRGDQEPLPSNEKLLDAWALFHNGAYIAAYQTASTLGDAGATLAARAS